MRFSPLLAALLGLLLVAPRADAQFRFLPYVGYATNVGYSTDEDADLDEATEGGFLIGVGAEVGLTPGILPIGLSVRPSVETYFLSGEEFEEFGEMVEVSQNAFRANLDLIGSFSPPLSPVGVYAGAGVTYATYSAETTLDGDAEDDELDGSAVGVNLLAGVRFGGGFIAPFVQGRYSLADPTPEELQEDELGTDDFELGNSFSVQAGLSIGL